MIATEKRGKRTLNVLFLFVFVPITLFAMAAALPFFVSTVSAGELEDKLMEAAKKGDTVTVQTPIDKGADVNAKDEDGKTALMQVSDLIEKGKFGAAGKDGKMISLPLTPEEKKNYDEVIRMLKASGAK